MNREIKFRVWNKIAKCYVMHLGKQESTIATFNLLSFSDYLNINNIKNIDFFIIQQSTGLNDEKGKEIYEGDILYNIDNDEYFSVCWNENAHWQKYSYADYTYENLFINLDSMLIKGNIFENKDLLKVKAS